MGDRAGHSPGPCVVLPYDVEIAEPHAGEVEVRDRGREQPQRWCKSPAALQESKRHLKSREAGPCAILPYDVMISEPHAGVLEVRDRDARRGRDQKPQGLALEGFPTLTQQPCQDHGKRSTELRNSLAKSKELNSAYADEMTRRKIAEDQLRKDLKAGSVETLRST